MRRWIVLLCLLGLVACSSSADDVTLGSVPPRTEASSDADDSGVGPTTSNGPDETDSRDDSSSEPEGESGRGNIGDGPDVPPDVIAGFGVNGQPHNWGSDGTSVKAALDLLVDDLGATKFRVELARGESYWEQENDDDDPFTFNWDRYDEYFSSDDFQDVWAYVAHLNERGVDDVQLSAEGLLPDWMGGEEVARGMEDEYVETMVALLLYARTRAPEPRPVFQRFNPWNETDLGPPEGFRLDVGSARLLLGRLIERMNQFPELDDIELVVPEASSETWTLGFRDAIAGDEAILSRISAVSFHRYIGYAPAAQWAGADPPQWLSEFNSSRAFYTGSTFCYTPDWGDALDAVGNLIGALQSGVTAGLVWADYDATHIHSHDAWESFGLLATSYRGSSNLCGTIHDLPSDDVLDAMTYSPKPSYHALRHVMRYVRPGAVMVPVSADDDALAVVAFENPDGSVVVAGRNGGNTSEFRIDIDADKLPDRLIPVVSTDGSYGVVGRPVAIDDGRVTLQIPGSSAFSLVTTP